MTNEVGDLVVNIILIIGSAIGFVLMGYGVHKADMLYVSLGGIILSTTGGICVSLCTI